MYLHPADILDDLDVVQGGLLELQELGRLLYNRQLPELYVAASVAPLKAEKGGIAYHQMLELESAFGHIVTLAPLLNTGDVVVDLKATLP